MGHVGAVQHFQNIVVGQVLVERAGHCLELLEIDDSVLVLIEKAEHGPQAVLGLGFTNSRADDVQEFLEGDGVVGISEPVNERQNERISLVEAQFFQHLVDFHGVDSAAAVLIENFERVLQLFVIFGSQSVLPGDWSGGLSGRGLLGLCGSAHKICKEYKGSLQTIKFNSLRHRPANQQINQYLRISKVQFEIESQVLQNMVINDLFSQFIDSFLHIFHRFRNLRVSFFTNDFVFSDQVSFLPLSFLLQALGFSFVKFSGGYERREVIDLNGCFGRRLIHFIEFFKQIFARLSDQLFPFLVLKLLCFLAHNALLICIHQFHDVKLL